MNSPRIIKLAPLTITTSHTGSFEYTDPTFNIIMTKSIRTLTFTEMSINPAPVELGVTLSTDERVKLFGGMQALIKSCVDNAENIKDTIHNIAIEKLKPKTEEERVVIMKMDFMKVKQWLMDDIRNSKIYKEFSVLNSTKKLKPFSQTFHSFILDRNKYTHGQLCFLSPSYDFVLEYIDTTGHRIRYAFIDLDILTSYNEFYKEIKKVIFEYSVIHQKRYIS